MWSQFEMKCISQRVKTDILSWLKQGKSVRTTAKHFKVGKSTVHRIFKQNNMVSPTKQGRPRKLTKRQEKLCASRIVSGESSSCTQLTKLLIENGEANVSRKTVARALNRRGLKAGEKKKKTSIVQEKYCCKIGICKKI